MYAYEKPDNLVELWENSVVKHARNKIFGTKNSKGVYEWLTYAEVDKMVNDLRAGLALLGIKKGSTVGIIAGNRYEWAVAAFATYGREARFVPLYEHDLLRTWKYIIADSAVEVLFVANEGILEKVRGFLAEIPTLKNIFIIDSDKGNSMTVLMKQGATAPVAASRPDPQDVAGILYTSGTTGEPKGVLLSHGNLTSNFLAARKRFPELNEKTVTLAILPWAHSYGQNAELYPMIYIGAAMGLVENTSTIANDIALVRPTWLFAVPRILNAVYDSITKKIRTGGLAEKLFDMGVNSGKRETNKKESLSNIKMAIADKIVFNKIREKLGGRLEGVLSGSAVLKPEVAQFFFDIGIPTYDCYGLTEASPAVTVNAPDNHRLGSVGKALDGVKITIDKTLTGQYTNDGEVVVHGPGVMLGYHNKHGQTKAALTNDGGLRTGDRGYLDKDGFLFITGRIKEQYKLDNGIFVFPSHIEEDITTVPYILNAFVYGDNRHYNVCLIVPNFANLKGFIKEKGLTGNNEALTQNKVLIDFIASAVTKALEVKYTDYEDGEAITLLACEDGYIRRVASALEFGDDVAYTEMPKKYALIAEPFTVANGLLTQTLKPRRNAIWERFKDTIEDLYE